MGNGIVCSLKCLGGEFNVLVLFWHAVFAVAEFEKPDEA